jgi:hypothetical protein
VRNPILRTELKVVDDTRAERLRSPHNSGFQELIGCFRKAMILPLGVCTLTTALHLAASTDSADHDFCCSYVAPLFFCGYVRQRAENSLQRSNLELAMFYPLISWCSGCSAQLFSDTKTPRLRAPGTGGLGQHVNRLYVSV